MFSRASAYAFANARSRALRSFMLTPANYDMLLRAKNLPMMIQTLLSMPAYSQYTRELMQAKTPAEVEKILTRDYYDKASGVSTWVSERRGKQLLKTLSTRLDIENLKLLLRAVFTGMKKEEVSLLVLPSAYYPLDTVAKLLEGGSISDIIASAWSPRLRSLLLDAKTMSEDFKSPVPLELAADSYFIDLLWRQAQQLPMVDKQTVRHVLGAEVDVKSMLACLRAKTFGAGPEEIDSLIPNVRYRLADDLERAARAATIGEALRILAEGAYSSILRGVQSLSEAERRLTLYMIDVNEQVFTQYPFQLAVVIAFLNLKYHEIRNLKSIVIGKYYGLPISSIKSVLFHVIT